MWVRLLCCTPHTALLMRAMLARSSAVMGGQDMQHASTLVHVLGFGFRAGALCELLEKCLLCTSPAMQNVG